MAYKSSVFPEGGYDTFIQLYDLPPSYEPLVLEFAQLRAKSDKTPEEESRFNELTTMLQNYILDTEKWNKFCDALTGVQKFFLENTQGYIDGLKTETRQVVDDGKVAINTSKNNALVSIEQKKDNIIAYMDETTAGAIRNDIGIMGDSTIEGRSLVDKTNALKIQVDTNTQDITENTNKFNILSSDLDEHKADYVYQKAGGTATAITLTINNLKDGYPITFIASANNNGAATTINGKPLYKPNTTTAPNLVTGKAYTVWYNSTNNYFFIKASAEGNASVEDVLAGKTFSNDNDTGLTGTMPNNGKISRTITTQGGQISIPQGYHDGSGIVKAQLANLVPENIKKDVNVGGVVGTLEYLFNPNTPNYKTAKVLFEEPQRGISPSSRKKMYSFIVHHIKECTITVYMYNHGAGVGDAYVEYYVNNIKYKELPATTLSTDLNVTEGDTIDIYIRTGEFVVYTQDMSISLPNFFFMP